MSMSGVAIETLFQLISQNNINSGSLGMLWGDMC